MKSFLLLLTISLFSVGVVNASSIENKIKEFSIREYPNDPSMQRYTYNKQVAAYNYLVTVKDPEVKEFSAREYSYDYAMQKYTYDKQLAAKRYMTSLANTDVKKFSVREYPYDYSMQKYGSVPLDCWHKLLFFLNPSFIRHRSEF